MVHKSVLSLSVHPLQLLQWCVLSGAEINTEHIQNEEIVNINLLKISEMKSTKSRLPL